ncbi:tail fibers protein [Synechococcus phage S-SBP1]|uniref:Tail fibers protein n=1 Tax=Synechococcus phage S-SBP1 TaxID=2735125 RepID=A0A6M4ELV9_9CAUD|nr:tail fibers protein [Synechococcus phage S-SBP1]
MSIKLKGSTDGSVSINAPADTSPTGSDITLTLPTTVGSANQFVKNGGTAGELKYSSMVEDSSGRLLVGDSSDSSDSLLIVQGNAGDSGTGGQISIQRGGNANPTAPSDLGSLIFKDSAASRGAVIGAVCDNDWASNDFPTRLEFKVTKDNASSPTERMRISSTGDLFTVHDDNGVVSRSTLSAGTSNTVFIGQHNASSITAGTNSCKIFTNGNIQNSNNSYSQLSDVKLKENIVDANSQWDDLKAIQIRNWNFKAETGYETHTQIGVVAQEIETVSPGLVYETPDRETVQISVLDKNGEVVLDENGEAVVTTEERDLGTVTKSVNYSVLYMKAVKALQEAQTRIETLETKVAALETAE